MNERNAPKPRSSRKSDAFTLVEMLVVVGIIGLLMALLLPAISAARKTAVDTDNRQLLATLVSAIEAYHSTHGAYPGPLANRQISAAIGTDGELPAVIPAIYLPDNSVFPQAGQITMSENLYLGLNGGLIRGSDGGIQYSQQLAQSAGGAQGLGAVPKAFSALAGNVRWSQGDLPNCEDSAIPEFMDKYPDNEMPILYLRARRGVTSTSNTADDNPVITLNSRKGTYDTTQYQTYCALDNGTGLETVTPAATNPQDAYSYFLANPGEARPYAKQKDSYILINAGRDRQYGTADDITTLTP